MRADAYPLDSVLGERQQWVVPVYQRHYEWETGEDKQLPKMWEDLKDKAVERLDSRTPFPHYFGAIIFAEPNNQPFGAVRQRFLVDGQQRITTFQLTLTAIREVARDHQVLRLLDVINAYIYNDQSRSMADPVRERYKLWPSSFDRTLYQNIVEGSPEELRVSQKPFFHKNGQLIKGRAPNLLRAFWFLYEQIAAFIRERQDEGETPEQVLDALLAGFLSGFQIVVIQLDQHDDAQEIFAALNGKAKLLSPFDLIRNDVFHRARSTDEDDQKLFDEHWKLFEDPFWSEQVRQGRLKRTRADHLIAHAVVAETGWDVNVGKIATEYQRYARERAFPTIAEELTVLIRHAATYRAMEEQDQTVLFARIANVLRTWDMSTFHPLILWINAQPFEDDDKARFYALIESYIVRREICGLPAKNYNKVVMGLIRHAMQQDDPLHAFVQHLYGLTGDASRMPTDAHVEEAFARRKAYGVILTPRLRYILQQIEHAKRSKFDEVTVSSANLTIEHVMPRSWAENWPLPNGATAPCESAWQAASSGQELEDETKSLMETRQQAIDTLGNLTLVTGALNPSMGKADWKTKHARLRDSLLVLNREIATRDCWDEEVIRERAADLAAVTNRIWSAQAP